MQRCANLLEQIDGLKFSEAALPIAQQQLDTRRTKRQCILAQYDIEISVSIEVGYGNGGGTRRFVACSNE